MEDCIRVRLLSSYVSLSFLRVRRLMEVYKVLPVTEEDGGGANDDVNSFYVDEKEVKVEVMRARGAGGQVRCERT